MKVIIALAIVAAFACVNGATLNEEVIKKIEEHKKRAEEHVEYCKKEIGIEDDIARKLTFGDFSVNDRNSQCFVKCFFERAGFVDKGGVPQKEVIISKLGDDLSGKRNEKLEALISTCIEEKGSDDCHTAFKIYQCYWTGMTKSI